MKRRLLGITAGAMLLLTLGTGSVLADNPDRTNPADWLFDFRSSPLFAAPPHNQEPIAEPGTTNNYSNLDYYRRHWFGHPLKP